MKKMLMVMVAVVMAIGFSAFTGATTETQTYYFIHDENWEDTEPMDRPCLEGDNDPCTILNPITSSGQVNVYETKFNTGSLLKKP